MLASLSPNTIKQYDVCLKKWWHFCKNNSVDVYDASIPTVVYFLTNLFDEGSQYGTLNSCRSALSLVLGPTISHDDRLQRFFKGVFRLRPPTPKYNTTWDTNLVLNHLSEWFPNDKLNLERLSNKTITLLALTTAHRVQTISKINIKNIEITSECISIKIPDILKTSRLGCKQPIIYVPFFRENPSICPAEALSCYVNKTKPLRISESLFIATKRPHKPVGSQTLSRWIKRTLSECGVDTATFSGHSTRHAAVSHAHARGVSVDAIRNTAGWSGQSNTFAKFYQRPILSNNDCLSLALSVLNK